MTQKGSPKLFTDDPPSMGQWVAENGALGQYMLVLASGWPDGLNRFKRHIVEQQCAGSDMTADEFMIQLMQFAHTGELDDA